MQLLPLTDEKLEDYLGVWNTLIEQGDKGILDVTLTLIYDCSRFPFGPWTYTVAYGEEKRELTYEQALRVQQWLKRIPD